MNENEVKPLDKMSGTLALLLKIHIAVTIVAVGAGFYEYQVYSSAPAEVDVAQDWMASDGLTAVVGLMQMLMFLSVGIVFLCWIYRANKNLGILSKYPMRFTPGWSIGWYFIPVANLFKPFQAMDEIYVRSKNTTEANSRILGWWWLFWIASGVAGQIAMRMTFRAVDLETSLRATTAYIVSDSIDIVLGVLALLLVMDIWKSYSKNYGPQKNVDEQLRVE